MKRTSFAFLAPLAIILSACSSSDEGSRAASGGAPAPGVGGGSSSGGAPSSGGSGAVPGGSTAVGTGGSGTGGQVTGGVSSGGAPTGGASSGGNGGTGGAATGGANSGGVSTGGSTGGMTGTGGAAGSGGTFMTGGASATGGTTATGGSSETGGASDTGGSGETGGATGVGGASGVGGSSGSGGGSATGGSQETGGSSGTGGSATWHCSTSTTISERLEQEYSTWKAAFAQTCSNGSAVIKNGGGVVSEGIGYGMLIAAAMEDRVLFDGLWQFYTDHLDPNGLMDWSMDACAAPGSNGANAATDAELDAAMALVQADSVWPDGGYLEQAGSLAALILEYEVDEDCSGRTVLRPGDMFGGCRDSSNQKINPSYFAPGYYQVFATKFPDQASKWTALIDGTYELLDICQDRMDGLVPDWCGVDGSDWYNEDYSYDACRTPWRVATHYAWSGDERARSVLQRFTDWVDGHGGLPAAAQQNNSAFLGAFAVGACYDQAKLDSYVSGWLGSGGDDTPYFQATLRVLYMLLAAGRFSSTL